MQPYALFSNHSVMVQVVAGLTALMLHIQLDYIWHRIQTETIDF